MIALIFYSFATIYLAKTDSGPWIANFSLGCTFADTLVRVHCTD